MTKTKSTKRALLMSGLALLMCVSMLIGSTFAWFTDSVTSSGNKIVAGTLDVDLLMAGADGEYASIGSEDAAIFGEGSLAQNNAQQTLWEPGKTQIVYLAVANNGSLDLKYNIALNVVDGGLIGSLEYAIVDGAQYGALDTYTDWATLKEDAQTGDVVAGTTVAAPNGAIKADEDIEYFALAVHMKEEAGNEYQGKDITIDVTVLATQLSSESDSFGSDYDANVEFDTVVYNAADLQTALAAGKNVIVGADIDLGTTTVTIPNGVTTTLDLNGCEISGVCNATNGTALTVDNGATLNIKDSGSNGKISYAAGSANQGYAIKLMGNLNLYSGTIELTGNWDSGICYAVDIAPSVWGGAVANDAVFNMYGGKVVSSKDAIRVSNWSSESYNTMTVGFNMEGGEVIAARDGIFMQQTDAAKQRDLSVTVTGGTIKADVRPIRVYSPTATGTLSGNAKPMTITAKSDALVLNGTVDTSMTWHTEGKIAVGGGMTVDNLNQFANITLN